MAEYYHEETKYSVEGLYRSPPLDPEEAPVPYKEYHSDRALDLTGFLPLKDFPVTGPAAPARQPDLPNDAELARLSRMLYFTAGVTGVLHVQDGAHLLRAAPSAGALYPTEIYAVTEGVEGIEDGIHYFSVRNQQLVPVFDGKFREELVRLCFGHPAVGHARVNLLLTGNYHRSRWRYRERCYRRILLDTGHVVGNLGLYAPHEGYRALPVAGFLDAELGQLLFLEESEEGPLLVTPLVPIDLVQGGLDLDYEMRRSPRASFQQVSDPVVYLAFHRGSSIRRDEPVLERPSREASSSDTTPVPLEDRFTAPMAELIPTIVRRRSTRAFSGGPLDSSSLSRILDFGYRATRDDPWALTQAAELVETYVLVTAVEGVSPGIYLYRSGSHDLLPVRAGRFSQEIYHFCLEQDLAGNAAATIVHAADLHRALEIYGERAYRYLHLDAGTIGQYVNLAATHLGVGVSGIGGFYDDEINTLLKLSPDRPILYVTVLGDPIEVA